MLRPVVIYPEFPLFLPNKRSGNVTVRLRRKLQASPMDQPQQKTLRLPDRGRRRVYNGTAPSARFEHATPCSASKCSNPLSYEGLFNAGEILPPIGDCASLPLKDSYSLGFFSIPLAGEVSPGVGRSEPVRRRRQRAQPMRQPKERARIVPTMPYGMKITIRMKMAP
jgi:hypothetical protein